VVEEVLVVEGSDTCRNEGGVGRKTEKEKVLHLELSTGRIVESSFVSEQA